MIVDISKIHQNIEDLVQSHDINYIDAVIHYCEQNEYDIEAIGNIIALDLNLTSKIEEEAENLHFIKKIARLPLWGQNLSPFLTYKYYVAIKRHFTDERYDFFKYKGRIKASEATFLKRKDKYYFEKLAKHDSPPSYILSNICKNPEISSPSSGIPDKLNSPIGGGRNFWLP